VIKFLADANIEKRIVDCLLRFGFDVKWIPDYNCEMDDAALLTMANNEKRILITNEPIAKVVFPVQTGIQKFLQHIEKTGFPLSWE
jgi:hypothetical protein